VKSLLLLFCLSVPTGPVTLRGVDARGQSFDLSSLRGHTVAITFGSRHTAKASRKINDQLAGYVTVVNVVDMRGIPGWAHKIAMKKIRKSDQPGRMLHLVDENGQVARSFGVDSQHHVDILLVDGLGRMMGHFVDLQQLAQAEARLRQPRRFARPAPVKRE
jgi:hypothetical protein